jgi:hypothetical protein
MTMNARGLGRMRSCNSLDGNGPNRVGAILRATGITVFARIDHAAGAAAVGHALRPTERLIFGAPTAGTPLLQTDQTIGIGLPLKALVWEDASGVWSLQLIQRGWRRGTRSVTTRRTSSMPSVGALAKFASRGRRLIQPCDRPRDRPVLLKPARCCPTAPPRTHVEGLPTVG